MSAIPTTTIKVDTGRRIRSIRVVPESNPFAEGEWLYIDDILNIVAYSWRDIEVALAKYVPEGHRLVEFESVRYR